jgi:ammonia channel protein AmtB
VKFSALMVFVMLWLTIVYFPIAHMVWYWAGPDFLPDAPTDYGLICGAGARSILQAAPWFTSTRVSPASSAAS